MESERVPGIDTIRHLVGSPPRVIVIPYKVMRTEEILRQAWNALYIAIIPYCFSCKTPLDWHSPPDNNKVFTCPKCNRQWMLGAKDKNIVHKEGTMLSDNGIADERTSIKTYTKGKKYDKTKKDTKTTG